MPMSAVAGAFILTAADVAGRLIARPGEIEVGILTAFVGAPILVIVAMKSKMKVI
jgi:iron complex transport system permease protein